jgi:STE24 endopeptidase
MGLAAAFVTAVIATLVLLPRDQLPPVVPVNQYTYFGTEFIARADDFRSLQSRIGLLALAVMVLVPLAFAIFWPRRRASTDSRWWDRRSGVLLGVGGVLRTVLVAAGVTAITLLCTLPLDYWAFTRAGDFGVSVESTGGWLWRWTGGSLLVIGAIALLALLFRLLVNWLGRWWWPAFGAVLVALAFTFQLLAPVAISPLFADFQRMPAGQARGDIRELSERAGVDPGDLYVVDAGQRTTGVNAYVTGIGPTKRVVLYDTLLKKTDAAERRQVIAHELAHAYYDDLLTGLVWFAFVAFGALFGVDLIARALAARRDVEFESPAAAAMVLAAVMLAIAITQPVADSMSREVEARADAFALETTQDPDGSVALTRRLTQQNLSRPDPPTLLHTLFGTHPKPVDRIGMAEGFRRELDLAN